MQLRIGYIHEEQITLFTAFHEQLKRLNDNCKWPTAHSVFKQSV